MTHIIVEYEHPRDQQFATDAGQILAQTYPGHPWYVNVHGGILEIKNMRVTGKWAMVLHYKKVAQDYAFMRRGIVWAGGELLERAGLSRSVPDDSPVRIVDGVPFKDLLLQ